MSKSGKIIAAVAVMVLLVMAGGIFWLSSAMDDVGVLKIETEDVPCGLEWGMTMEEVRAVLESAGYVEEETDTKKELCVYRVPVYQGRADAGVLLLCVFNEEGKLDWVNCNFKEFSYGGYIESAEKLDEIRAAFEKAYEKECEEVFVDPDPIASYEYCLMEKSLVSFNCHGGGFSVYFHDREGEGMTEYIEALREEFGK